MEPPGGHEVGRANVGIHGDPGPFKRTVRDLSRTVIRRITATITGDADPARREIASLRSWADSLLSALHFRVDASTGPAHARLAALQSQARALARDLRDFDVDVNTAEGQAALEALLQRARRLQQTSIEIDVDVNDAGLNAVLTGLRSRLNSVVGAIEATVDLNTAPARREGSALKSFLTTLFADDYKQTVRLDTSMASRAAGVFRESIEDAQRGMDRFAHSMYVVSAVLRFAMRGAIMAVIAGLAPLLGMLTIAAGAVGALAAAGGLLAAAFIPSIAALTNSKAAAEGLAQSEEALQDATEDVADAREERARVEEEVAESIQDAREAIAESVRNEIEVEREGNRAIADARKAAADQLQSLREAEEERVRAIADAMEAYQDAIEQARRNNAQARQEARQAEADYIRTVRENRQEEIRAIQAVKEAEEGLRDARMQAAEMVQDAIEARAQALEDHRDTIEQAADLIARAYENAQRAAERVRDQEENLERARDRLVATTRALRDAQEQYNDAARNEPLRVEEAAITAERTELRRQEIRSRIQRTMEELRLARYAGDPTRIAELERQLAEQRLDARQNNIDLIESEAALNDIRENGSSQLQQARAAVEAAWQARVDAQRDLVEAARALDQAQTELARARTEINKARAEADEMIHDSWMRVVESRRAVIEARREGAELVIEAERRLRESEAALRRTRVENAREERQAALESARAFRQIEVVYREGAEAISDAYENLIRTRVQQNRAVAQQEEAFKEALRDVRDTVRQTERDIREARRQTLERRKAYQEAVEEGAQRIEDAEELITDALKRQKKAQEDVGKAADETGAKLTRTQEILLAAAQVFASTFLAAFAPARAEMDLLAARIIQIATRALPYLGGIALEVAREIRAEFEEFIPRLFSPEQQRLFRQFFEALPGVAANLFGAALEFALGLFNVLSISMPWVEELASYISTIATRFLEWTLSAEGQQNLREFFERSAGIAATLRDIIVAVARILAEIGTSRGFKWFLDAVRDIVEVLANNLWGIKLALMILGGIAQVIAFLARIPFFGGVAVALATLAGSLLLFGAAPALIGLFTLRRLFRNLRDLFSLRRGRGAGVDAVGDALDDMPGKFGRYNRAKDRSMENTRQFSRVGVRSMGIVGAAVGGLAGAFALFGRTIVITVGKLITGVRRRVGGAVRSFGRTIVITVGRIVEGIRTGIRNAIRGVVRVITTALPRLATSAAQALRAMMQSIQRAVRGVFRFLGNMLRAYGRTLQVQYAIADQGTLMLGRALEAVGRFFQRAAGWVANGIRRLGNAIARIPRQLGNMLRGIGRVAANALRVIGRAISQWAAGSWRWFRGIVNSFRNVFGGRGVLLGILRVFVGRAGVRGLLMGLLWFLGLSNPAGWIVLALYHLIGPFVRLATWFAFEFKPRIWALVKSVFGPRAMLLSEMENFRQTMRNMPFFGGIYEQAERLAAWLGNTFVPWLRKTVSGIWGWIADVWDGMIQGIASAVRKFWDWLKEVGDEAWRYLKQFWERRSPSGKTRRLFRDVIRGMIVGGEDERPNLMRFLSNLTSDAQRELESVTVGRIPMTMERESAVRRRTIQIEYANQASMRRELADMKQQLRKYAERPLKFKLFLGEDELKEFVIDVQEQVGRDQYRSGAARQRNRF